MTVRLEIGATVLLDGEPIGVVVGLNNGNPLINMNWGTYEFALESIEVLPADASEFPVGTKVDSSRIQLFKRLNRGEIIGVHSDGMVMVRWDREGECLQYPSELKRILTLWDHLKG